MAQAQIFISYRRDDAAGYARAVYDALAREFGDERVFIDVDDIDAGQSFADVIRSVVGESKVLLVLIGDRWMGKREGAPARIADPADFVRLEVATALAKGMRVIPLLLDGVVMPAAAQLPDDLHALTEHNALEVGNTRFAGDMQRLVTTLRESVGEPLADVATPSNPRAGGPNRPWAWASIAAALIGCVWIGGWLLRVPVTGGSAARAEINGDWVAELNYDWSNARYTERFRFAGESGELHGTASFLGVSRDLLEGIVERGGGLRFVTRTDEIRGDGATADTVHRYRGRLEAGDLHFVMQTEGGSAPHEPVEFIARRPAQGASAALR